jgi:hypothetical protein
MGAPKVPKDDPMNADGTHLMAKRPSFGAPNAL